MDQEGFFYVWKSQFTNPFLFLEYLIIIHVCITNDCAFHVFVGKHGP